MRNFDRGRADVVRDLKAEAKGAGIEHKGLEVLAALSIVEMVKELGEQETIDLVSALISGAACHKDHVDGILTEKGLL